MSSLIQPFMWTLGRGTHLEEFLVALVTVDNVPVDEYFIQKVSHCLVANSTLQKGKQGGWTVTEAPCSNDSMEGAEKQTVSVSLYRGVRMPKQQPLRLNFLQQTNATAGFLLPHSLRSLVNFARFERFSETCTGAQRPRSSKSANRTGTGRRRVLLFYQMTTQNPPCSNYLRS